MWIRTIATLLRPALIALCISGACISGALVREHAGPWPSSVRTPGLFGQLCGTGPDGESGCSAVLASKWSAVDFNIPVLTRALTIRWSRVVVPVAFMGLAYFAFLGIWLGFAGPASGWGRRLFLIPLVAVLGGVGASVGLLWIMVLELETGCTWCLAIHAINGLLLAGILCMWPRKGVLAGSRIAAPTQTSFSSCSPRTLTTGAALRVMGVGLLVIMGLWLVRDAKLETRYQVAKLMPYKEFVVERLASPAFVLSEYYAESRQTIPERSTECPPESNDVEPTLVVFTDFSCSHCACFASRWKKDFRQLWEGPLRVTVRHFPLGRECNETVTEEIHPDACEASYAAEAARMQGGEEAFWKMHDVLFANMSRLSARPYAELARRIGLDAERLLADMESEEVRGAVAADIAMGTKLGVRGTPSLYLEGRPVPQYCLYNPVFWESASEELGQAASIVAKSEPDAEQNEAVNGGWLARAGHTHP